MTTPSEKELLRFRAKTLPLDNGCIVWTGQISRFGYGHFYVGKRCIRAHKYSYLLSSDAIPAGMVLDHLCGNRACVNPMHLEPVTPRENVMRSKTTVANINAAKTHCPKGHPYTGGNLLVRTNGIRECRACGREETQRYLTNNRDAHNARRRAARAARRISHA